MDNLEIERAAVRGIFMSADALVKRYRKAGSFTLPRYTVGYLPEYAAAGYSWIIQRLNIPAAVNQEMGNMSDQGKPRLLDQVRGLMRARHMSIRTEEAYVRWIVQYLTFYKERRGAWVHPSELGNHDINQFLTWLAVQGKVSASTQNQALSALLFLYSQVLKLEIEFDAVRAKKPARLPVVLSVDEVRRVLCAIPEGPYRIMAGLMYGGGLRLMEVCRLRVKDCNDIRSIQCCWGMAT